MPLITPAPSDCTTPLCHIKKLVIGEYALGPDEYEWRVVCVGCHSFNAGSTRANAVANWNAANPCCSQVAA